MHLWKCRCSCVDTIVSLALEEARPASLCRPALQFAEQAYGAGAIGVVAPTHVRPRGLGLGAGMSGCGLVRGVS